MSDFSNGMALGLANALPNAIQKLMMLGPQIENARQQGMLRGAQAQYNQQRAADTAADMARKAAASEEIVRRYGKMYAATDASKPQNIRDLISTSEFEKQSDVINKVYPMETNRELVQKMTSAGTGSFSENAGATPPISAFGQRRGGIDPGMDNQTLLNNLMRRQELYSRGVGMTEGKDMYKSVGNTGLAIDPYLGGSKVANDEQRNIYMANQNSILGNREEIRARRRATPIRGVGGGGGHKRRGGHGGRGGRGKVTWGDPVQLDGGDGLYQHGSNGQWRHVSGTGSGKRGGRRSYGSGGNGGRTVGHMTEAQANAILKSAGNLYDNED